MRKTKDNWMVNEWKSPFTDSEESEIKLKSLSMGFYSFLSYPSVILEGRNIEFKAPPPKGLEVNL